MDRTLQALFALLQAGLWGRYDDAAASVFPLSAEEWERVFTLARQQTVTGIAFRGLDFLPEEAAPPMVVAAKWMAHADRIEQSNRIMNGTVAKLYGHFASVGVEAVLQKGQGVAAMYPEPLLRECGDIDLYFPGHDGVSDPLAGIPGAVRKRQPDNSWSYLVDGIVVEHHADLVDIQSPRIKRYVRRLIQEKGFEKVVTGDGVEVMVPAPEVNLLLLSSHILKHAFGVGIGLRQFCDYAVARRYYEGRVNEEEMREIWRMTGLEKWEGLLEEFIGRFLDSDCVLARNDNEDFQDDRCHSESCTSHPEHYPCHSERSEESFDKKKTDVLLDIVLKGGNFGVYSKDRENASHARWVRKMQTFRSLAGNVRFAFRYAPREWFWTIVQLLGGQFR